MKRRFSLVVISLSALLIAKAETVQENSILLTEQETSIAPVQEDNATAGQDEYLDRAWPLVLQNPSTDALKHHLNISLTGGSTGLGIELAAPVGNKLQVRTGFDFMPAFEKTVNFGIQVGDDPATSQSKFEKLSGLLSSFTGQKVDDNVDMIGKPSYHNFKLLVDVMPFKNKCWRLTAGFYWGNSDIAKAYNTTEDMPTLFAVSMYNDMYQKFKDDYYWDHPLYGDAYIGLSEYYILKEKFEHYGRMGLHVGDYSHDIYAKGEDGKTLLDDNGDPIVLHKAGSPYIMEPDADCMVKAKIKANAFKPYLGFGYGTDLSKSKTGWGVSFDAGLLFWGGSPSVITHDGTDLAKDLCNVRGKVGRYVSLIKDVKMFPVLNFRITKVIF